MFDSFEMPITALHLWHTVIYSFNFGVAIIFLWLSVLNYRRHGDTSRSHASSVLYLYSALIIISSAFAFMYYEHMLSEAPVYAQMPWYFTIGKHMPPFQGIFMVLLYTKLFNVTQLQPHYKKWIDWFYALSLASFIVSFFIDEIRLWAMFAYLLPWLGLLLIVLHCTRYLDYISSARYIRLMGSIGLLVTLAMWLFTFVDNSLGSEYLFLNQTLLSFLLAASLVITIFYGTEQSELFKSINQIDTSNLLNELSQAITTQRFHMEYQPQIDIQSHKVSGVEALIRWVHPTQGLIEPEDFIPLAETSGQIHDITKLVIAMVVADCARLKKAGYEGVVSMNLSAKNLNKSIVNYLLLQLDKHEVPVEMLVLEITETALLQGGDKALRLLNEQGFKLSLDDYGTGYSSLSYLTKLDLHELKIDGAFITDLLDNENNFFIVKNMLRMSRALGFQVVAEGVEDLALARKLRDMQCEVIQGFAIAPAMNFVTLKTWLESNVGENMHFTAEI